MRQTLKALILGGALVASTGSAALAQDGNFTLLNGSGVTSNYGAPYVSRQVGLYGIRANHLPGTPTIDMVCVDVIGGINVGTTWDAWITSLGASDGELDSKTYFGSGKREEYKMAVYLSTQFTGDVNTDQWIHAAIWNLTNPAQTLVPGVLDLNVAAWIAFASANYMTAGLNYNYAWVVSDVEKEVQELAYYQTPEPATMGLLATGLVGIAAYGLRRRRKV